MRGVLVPLPWSWLRGHAPWGGCWYHGGGLTRAWHDIALAAFTYVEVFGKTQQLLGIVRCKRNEYETIMS